MIIYMQQYLVSSAGWSITSQLNSSKIPEHLTRVAFSNVTRNQQGQISFKIYWNQIKTENAHFINKIMRLLKLLNFLFTHLKLILMNSKNKITLDNSQNGLNIKITV